MALPISTPVAISAISALLRYRARVDSILALKEATADLPFALPPAPQSTDAHLNDMFEFFDTEHGVLLLELRNLREDFVAVKLDPRNIDNLDARRRVFQLYYENSDAAPIQLGPNAPPALAEGGQTSPEMRLAYYAVSSRRLSRNKPVSRLLLAAADTLLEVAGQNASLFISNPKTEAVVATLIDDFAIKRDFDDDSGEQIFQSLLRAVVISATEHAGDLSDRPALGALYGALSDARAEFGDEFVARILTREGFQGLVGTFLIHVADDPAFLANDERLRSVLQATITEIGQNFPEILADSSALLGILEVTLTAAAGEVEGLLDNKVAAKPLLTAVFVALAKEIEARGENNQLLRSVASGELVPDLLSTALAAIGEDPDRLGTAAGVNDLVATLVAGVAAILATREIADAFTDESLREIASRSLLVLAGNSSALALESKFATNVVVAVIRAASGSVQDGLTTDDLEELAGAALTVAIENVHLLEMEEGLVVIVDAAGAALAQDGIKKLLTPPGRRDALLEIVEVVAANPAVWDRFEKADLVLPLISSALQGISTDSSKLLSGPALVRAIRRVLSAAARRGQVFIDGEVTSEHLAQLLAMALRAAEKEIGRTVDADNVPDFLGRVVLAFLKEPFELVRITAANFKELIAGVLSQLEAA